MQIVSIDPNINETLLLELVVSSELRSEHPLGRAIVGFYKERSNKLPIEPEKFQLLPGRGVLATVNGQNILAGNESLFTDQNILLPKILIEYAEKSRMNGSTIIYIALDGHAVGMIALSDTVRPDAADTVNAINKSSIHITLLTGDSQEAALHIAHTCNIHDVRPNCLPENKLEIIKECGLNNELICMVGDGINDAPALKAAHVGIAMGGIGSDIAIDAADMVLVSDDIKELPHLLQLARKTMSTIHFNLAASMILNFVAIILAVTGWLNPIAGALVHNLGSVAVIINSSLLLNWVPINK